MLHFSPHITVSCYFKFHTRRFCFVVDMLHIVFVLCESPSRKWFRASGVNSFTGIQLTPTNLFVIYEVTGNLGMSKKRHFYCYYSRIVSTTYTFNDCLADGDRVLYCYLFMYSLSSVNLLYKFSFSSLFRISTDTIFLSAKLQLSHPYKFKLRKMRKDWRMFTRENLLWNRS